MPHETRIVHCLTPNAPHAFDGIPVQHRRGPLDRVCPVCHVPTNV